MLLFKKRKAKVLIGQSGFTLTEIAITIVIFLILIGLLLGPLGDWIAGRTIPQAFIRGSAGTTGTADVYGVFTNPEPSPLTLASKRFTFEIVAIQAGTKLNKDGTLPANTQTTPIPNVQVWFSLAGQIEFAPGAQEGLVTDAQGRVWRRIKAKTAEGRSPAQVAVTVMLPSANPPPPFQTGVEVMSFEADGSTQ